MKMLAGVSSFTRISSLPIRGSKMVRCNCSAHGSFLTAKGLKEAAQRRDSQFVFDGMRGSGYVDRVGSVSAFGPGPGPLWPTDKELLEQGERFFNGS